jgi:hypothetical protein
MKDQQAGEEIQVKDQRLVSPADANPGEDNDAERYQDQDHDAGTSVQRQSPAEGIAVLLGQVLICLGHSTYTDDIDALSFSLNHLFHRVDFLYREALPGIGATTTPTITQDQEQDPSLQDTLIRRQRIWSQLQAIMRTLNRLEPICHLLSDAIEGILDTLDATGDVFSFHVEIGSLADVPAAGFAQDKDRGYRFPIPTGPIEVEQWDSAFSAVLQSLKSWQQSYRASTSFTIQFSGLNAATGGLAVPEKDYSQEIPLDRLDAVFATLLESACVIFGDILPAFRTIAANDHEGTATLLFDLIQQSDHLLLELDATLEFLSGLIEDFTLGPRPVSSDESVQLM